MQNGTVLTIILNYKTPDMTLKAAAAARAAMAQIPGEIVIVDNGSEDGSFEQMASAADASGWCADGRLRVVQSPENGGFGAGMNFGMRAGLSDGSAPDFYYLQNSDAFPEDTTISALREFMITTPDAGLAGSFVCGNDGTPHSTAFRFPSLAGEFEGAARTGLITRLLPKAVVAMETPTVATPVNWTAGASLMLRRDMVDAIDGFDETFFLYFEETELCHRAAQAGWRTYFVPDSRITHVGSVSTGMKKWQRTPQYWFDSRQYYFTKTRGPVYALGATVARILGHALYDLRRLVQRKPQADPDHFLRDLIAHTFGTRRRPVRAPSVRYIPVAKDPK